MLEVFKNNFYNLSKYLYHYTTFDTALKYILPSGELRFSPFSKTNDPKENKEWEFSYYLTSPHCDIKDKYIISQYTNEFQKRCKVICFTKDDLRRSTSITTLNRGFARPRMWAQYAGNHSGVCLVFDKEILSRQIKIQLGFFGEIREGNVKYSDRIGNKETFCFHYQKIVEFGIEKFINYHFKKNYKTLFFEKLRDWSAEFEYRWVLLGSSEDYEYFAFEDSLKGIVLGSDFPEDYIYDIKDYSKLYHFPVTQLDWFNGYPILITV